MNTLCRITFVWLGVLVLLAAKAAAQSQVAPAITTQPVSRIVPVGGATSFTVVATGAPSPTYQWRRNGIVVAGATSATLNIGAVTANHAGNYTMTVTNVLGSVMSNVVTLVAITAQPLDFIGVSAGSSVSFGVGTTGVPTYQWRKDGVPIPGATGATLNVVDAQIPQPDPFDQIAYDVVITLGNVSTVSDPSLLTVFTLQPGEQQTISSVSVVVGRPVTFSVTGAANSTYQWRKGGVPIAGATAATFNISNVATTDTGSYAVTITTGATSRLSLPANITVVVPAGFPSITSQPANRTVNVGESASFTVAAAASPGLNYQWMKGGAVINGATGATYTIPNATLADAGEFRAIVTNDVGTLPSNIATLSVTPPAAANPGRLINLSIRTRIAAGDLIVGTVVGGTGTNPNAGKPVLIRAAGPSLAPLGVQDALADPRLEVFRDQTPVGANDNWGGGPVLTNLFAQVGAFAYLAANSLDAAVSSQLTNGNHSILVRGNGTGTVIAEIYDASVAATFNATTPRLINVSVRQQIDAGTVLTAGFVIGGGAPKAVLIRAVGPTLTGFGVSNAMTDPRVELYSGQTRIGVNEDWGGGAALANAFTSVGAFALPAASRDAAILMTLAPGNYTAQVSGAGGTAGVALVEVYEAP